MRVAVAITGFMAVCTFSIYYQYAYVHWPDVPEIYYNIANWVIWLSMSIAFFAIGRGEKNRKMRYLVFYNIGYFWLYLVISYLLNEINTTAIPMHKVFIALILTTLTGLLCYLLSHKFSRSEHGG